MKNLFVNFFSRVFTPVNFKKVVILFVIGFIGRILIFYFGNINVFIEFLHPISLVFYSFMACFTVFIHELLVVYNFPILPKFVVSFFVNIYSMFMSTISIISGFKFEYLSISYIKNTFKFSILNLNDKSKLLLGLDEEKDKSDLININDQDIISMNKGKGKGKEIDISEDKDSSGTKRKNLRRSTGSSSLSSDYQIGESSSKGKSFNNHKKTKVSPSETWTQWNTASKKIQVNSVNPYQDIFLSPSDLSVDINAIPTPNTVNRSNFISTSRDNNTNYNPIVVPGGTPRSGKGSFSTPSTMSPLFPTDLNQIGNSNTSGVLSQNDFSLPGQVPYFPISASTSASTANWTQAATKNPSPEGSVTLADRRAQIISNMAHEAMGYSSKEVVLSTPKVGGKLKLVFDFVDDGFSVIKRVSIKYEVIAKRKAMWYLWEENRGKYRSYPEFKKNFDPNSNIITQICKDIKSDIKEELKFIFEQRNPFNTGHLVDDKSWGQLGDKNKGFLETRNHQGSRSHNNNNNNIKSVQTTKTTGNVVTGVRSYIEGRSKDHSKLKDMIQTRVTRDQDRLNRMNAYRSNAYRLEDSKIKHKDICLKEGKKNK